MAVKKLRKLSDGTEIGFDRLLQYAGKDFDETIAVRLWRILLRDAMNPPHQRATESHEVIRTLRVPLGAIRHAAIQPRSTYRTYGPEAQKLLQGWVKTL